MSSGNKPSWIKKGMLILFLVAIAMYLGCNKTPTGPHKYYGWSMPSSAEEIMYNAGYCVAGRDSTGEPTLYYPCWAMPQKSTSSVTNEDHPWGGDNPTSQTDKGSDDPSIRCCPDGTTFKVVATNCGPAGQGGYICVLMCSGPFKGQVLMMTHLMYDLSVRCSLNAIDPNLGLYN